MRISVSNIAWEIAEEPAIAGLLRQRGIERVDIAPGKYFPDPDAATPAEVAAVRRLWHDRGFAITGMQSLLFGTTGLNLFHDRDGAMLRRLEAVCRIGDGLGVSTLTFGSPRQRDRSGLEDAEVKAIAVDFFGRVGDAARQAGVVLCLEPNPAFYGCNFMVGTDDTAEMVIAVDHPSIRLQLDVGALALNGEAAEEVITRYAPLIGHVHASEPGLVTLGDTGAPHRQAGAAIRAVRPDLVVTIEMIASLDKPHAAELERALDLALLCYGDDA